MKMRARRGYVKSRVIGACPRYSNQSNEYFVRGQNQSDEHRVRKARPHLTAGEIWQPASRTMATDGRQF